MSSPENRRRSERVILRMSVLVVAENEEQVVNAHGGLLRMRQHLHVGQSFLLNNPQNSMETSCRVVRTEEDGLDFFRVAFEFDRPTANFWPVVFPPADWVASLVK
jgi:hypothetical protein